MKTAGGAEMWLPSYLTSALDGSDWFSPPGRFTTGGEEEPVPTEEGAGSALESVWTFWRTETSFALTSIRTPDCSACSLVTIPGSRQLYRKDKVVLGYYM